MTNAEQIRNWDGPAGEYWVAEADRYDNMGPGFRDRVVAAVAAQPGEHMLDVGCGNGALSLALAPLVAPGGSVTGLDISGPMLGEAARRVAVAGVDNLTFIKGDAQVHPLDAGSYDAFVSRFGVMFFDDPTAAFTNLVRALRPGGRAAFTCWQELVKNDWLMVPVGAALAHVPTPEMGAPGAPGPFALADPDRLRQILTSAGLSEVQIDEVAEPMVLGTSVDDTVAYLRKSDIGQKLTKDVADDIAAAAWGAVADALAPRVTDEGVELSGTAWLVTATKEG